MNDPFVSLEDGIILKRNIGKNCSICVLDKAHRFTYMS